MQTATLALARVGRTRPLATAQSRFTHVKQASNRRVFSPFGNNATLITRIQHVDKRVHIFVGSDAFHRCIATAATAVESRKPSPPTLDVKLPDLSPPQDTEGPHIPFVPDFWESSRARTPDAIHHSPAADSPIRKVLLFSDTKASSPSYNIHLLSLSEPGLRTYESVVTSPENTGFWGDVATDLGLPRSSDVSASLAKTRDLVVAMTQHVDAQDRTESRPSSSRPLDAEETRGLWILLGILGSSWLAGGLFDPTKKKKKKATAPGS